MTKPGQLIEGQSRNRQHQFPAVPRLYTNWYVHKNIRAKMVVDVAIFVAEFDKLI